MVVSLLLAFVLLFGFAVVVGLVGLAKKSTR
jgi:hypothetical protein